MSQTTITGLLQDTPKASDIFLAVDTTQPDQSVDGSTRKYNFSDYFNLISSYYGITCYEAVQCANPISLTGAYNNGTLGVGATFTNNQVMAPLLAIDGYVLSLYDRVLLTAQANANHNGIWIVSDIGSTTTNWVLTRAPDFNQISNIISGNAVLVLFGNTLNNKFFQLSFPNPLVVGTTDLTLSLFDISVQVNGQVFSPSVGGTGIANPNTSTIVLGGPIVTTAPFYTNGLVDIGNTFVSSSSLMFSGAALNVVTAGSAVLNIPAGTTNVIGTPGSNSLSVLGNVTQGTWSATTIGPQYGGTGINNGSYTVSLMGSLSTLGGSPISLTASGTANLNIPTGSSTVLPVEGGTMTGPLILSGNPTVNSQAATKQYVDNSVQGFMILQSANEASAANLNAIYNNGSSGVGATLTNAGTMQPLVLDGITVSLNDRVLIKNQTTDFQNGIYVVTAVGSGAVNWVLTRSTDFDMSSQIPKSYILVLSGTTQENSSWTVNGSGPFTIGATPIDFNQFSGGFITAGNGISITGSQVSLSTPVTSANGGTGVSNTGTITLNGNVVHANTFTTSGNFPFTQTVTGTTNATFPNGNFTLVPTTGLGATGTWNISVTGNASTVSTNANLTGPITSVGNATSITANSLTYGDIQQVNLSSLLGNPTGSTANVSEIKIGNGLSFSGNVLDGIVLTAGNGITLTGNQIALASPVSAANGGTGVANGSNTLTFAGNVNFANAFSTTGAYALIQNITAATTVTFPSGTTTLVPTTGTGANGTWNISITGNSATTTMNANLTGPITSIGNATSITPNSVIYGDIQQVNASKLTGNPLSTAANLAEISLGTGLSFSGSTLNSSGGTLTSITAGIGLTGGTITGSGTIALSSPVSPSLGGTGVNNGANTITTSGNVSFAAAFTHAGAFFTTLTSTAVTNATLPPGTTTLVPTTGTGATGTWNINITGNASTVTTNANLTGPIVSAGNSTAITANAITYASIQQVSASKLLGNPTGATANVSEVNLGTGLSFSGSTLNSSGGTVTSVTAGTGLTGGTITGSGTISLSTPVLTANGGTGVTTSTGSGSNVLSTSPTLVTPILGAATATSLALTQATNQIALGATGQTTISSIAPSAARTYTINDLGANGNVVLSPTVQNITGYSNTTGWTSMKFYSYSSTTTGGVVTFYPTSNGTSGGTALFNTIISVQMTAVSNTATATSVPLASVNTVATNLTSVTGNVVVGSAAVGLGGASAAFAPNGTVVYITILGT